MLLILFPLSVYGCGNGVKQPGTQEPVPIDTTHGGEGQPEPQDELSTHELAPAPQQSYSPALSGTVQSDVTYCVAEGVELKMDVYYPAVENSVSSGTVGIEGLKPAVMYVHGGGWVRGDKTEGTGAGLTQDLVDAGFVVFAVNYRLAPQYQFPAMSEDVRCALDHTSTNGEAYGIDAGRIGAYGGSAGGHLVSLLGTAWNDDGGYSGDTNDNSGTESRPVQAVADLFGPADLTVPFEGGPVGRVFGQTVFGTSDSSSTQLTDASPVTHVDGADPPFLIIHGEDDTLVPISQSVSLYERLLAAGVPADLVRVENAGHGFAPAGGEPSLSRPEINGIIVDFFLARLV